MSKIIVFNSLTLDGVMQAPARPDEDVRGDFPYGGWATPYSDPEMGRAAAESGATAGGLLLGRRTYEDFYHVWPNRTDNPYTEVLNNSQKYVASRTLKEPLPWMNSTLLKGKVPETVATLKAQQDKDLVILGSGELIRTLMQHQLIDQYVLLIHPLVLGTGQRLFREERLFTLRLVDKKTT
jgi:dihydrofolate reductase